ncbi:formate dehydrogenase subunit delta [Pseudothioclava nitratireducens]|uniref:formate dehydrogenase subunit delta n=1 Tax=Pseudothioclava nitratireducens TaxID=1928646 RepID=UPI0023DAF6C0|nr:formate dehydrogenase subunit delta [Defluviimonas nitratireducens]MDF1621081.1 formate dehydrogenase subunit delta [Defluviimonas nitratireducens]
MSPDKMVRMANQIAKFFASQPEAARVPGVANHINDFWEPRMRAALLAHIAAGGEGLDPLVIEASAQLHAPA